MHDMAFHAPKQKPPEGGFCRLLDEVSETYLVGQPVSSARALSVLQGSEFLVCSTFTTGDDCTGMAHALARRSSHTGDVGNNRLGHVCLDVGSRFFFSRTADLADHDDRFGLRVFLEQLQDVDEVRTRDRVTADADAGGLTETGVSGLLHSFVGQGAGTRHDAYFAWQVDVAWHDADLALARSDNAWAVRADQDHTQLVALDLGFQQSMVGMPSVMQTISLMPPNAASRMESLQKGAGT